MTEAPPVPDETNPLVAELHEAVEIHGAPPGRYGRSRYECYPMIDLSHRLSVVGESHYKQALAGLLRKHEAHDIEGKGTCWAVLVPEPENQFDRNAVRVEIDGFQVGYLSADDAAAHQASLLYLRDKARHLACCPATILQSREGYTGVVLHINEPMITEVCVHFHDKLRIAAVERWKLLGKLVGGLFVIWLAVVIVRMIIYGATETWHWFTEMVEWAWSQIW